jgi:hypothetical protein
MTLFPPSSGELLDEDTFDRQFDGAWAAARTRFFKCEALQTYTEPADPSYQAFEHGDFAEARRLVTERIRAQRPMYDEALGRGLTLARVRVAKLPLTPYLSEYEIPSYEVSQELGETIRIALTEQLGAMEIGDYLLFDDDTAFVHRHDNQGMPSGAWRVSGLEAVKPYVALAEYLLSNSQSLENFLAAHIH